MTVPALPALFNTHYKPNFEETPGVPPSGGDGGQGPGVSPSCDPTDPAGNCYIGPPVIPIIGGGAPFQQPPQTPGTTSSGGGDNDVVNVTVSPNITIQNTGIEDLAKAVADAIAEGAKQAAEAVKSVLQSIYDALKSLVSAIWDAVKAALLNIWQILQQIFSPVLDALKNLAEKIGGYIQQALSAIKDALGPIFQEMYKILNGITKTVQQINDTLIQPIATFINTTVRTIAALTTAIERDLHSGLSGLLQIPTDIANAMTTLDASLMRTVQQLGTTNKQVAFETIDYEGQQLPDKYGKAYAGMLSGNTLANQIASTFSEKINLSTESLQQVSTEAISAIGPLLNDCLSILWQSLKGSYDQLHRDWTGVANVFAPLLDGLLGILTTFAVVPFLIDPLLKAAEEEANYRIPTTKLDAGSIVAAMRRGFLDRSTGFTELQRLGFDATRSQVLTDLGVYLADVGTVVDWWYRGLIPDDDLAANLSQQGILSRDVDLFKAGAIRLPSTDDVTRWLNFGVIDNVGATNILKTLRFDGAQIDAFLSTYQTRISAAALAGLHGRLEASGGGWLNSTFLLDTPDDVKTAGMREGLHPDDTRLVWMQHWNIPPLQTIIMAYFRGLRTLTEVQYAMTAYNVPKELWDDIIQVNRPLIPFRSIPTYVKAGYMNEAQAAQELAAHGFDLIHVNTILQAIKPTTAKTNATTATAVHTISTGAARTLFVDGALTKAQYVSILEAHNFPADLASAQADAELLAAHAKQRKQTLTDLENEVIAGVTTLDDALSQLASQQYTQAETAAFNNRVTRALKSGQKHPTIADMEKFFKNGLITMDQITAELKAQGWLDPWLTAWINLINPPAAPTAS